MSDERPPICFDEFVLDRRRCQLLRAGEAVPLRPKTLAVLLYLVENSDRVVSRQELLRAVWPGVRIEMQGVYQSVAELRAVFRGRDVIRTVRRTGYQWVAEPADARRPVPEFRAPRSVLRRAGARRALFVGFALMVAAFVTARVPVPTGTHWLVGDPSAAGDPEALVERARDYYAEGRFDVVEDILSAAVAGHPQHLGARLGLAQALNANGQQDRAFEMAQALHRDAIGMGAPHIRMESALLLSERNARDDPALARAYARETVELADLLHSPVVAGAAHERLGDIYLAEGRRSLAAIELQAAARRYRGLCPSSEERVGAKLELIAGRT